MTYEDLIHQQDYWPLQIIQDEYACALDIPLRIYQKSTVANLWQEIIKTFSDFFSSEAEFYSYVTNIAKEPLANMKKLEEDKQIWQQFFAEKKQNSCWLTNQSSGYFLIHSFQESQLWRWWEFFYYYHLFLIEPTSANGATYFACGEKHLHIVFQPITFTNRTDCVIVAGPVWQPIDNIAGSDFENERVTPLVEKVLSVISPITTRKHPLVWMGNKRFPMTSKYLLKRLQQVTDCFKQVGKMSVPVGIDIHRCDHTKLAEWSLFALQVQRRLPCEKILTQPCTEISTKLKSGDKIYARLDHPKILKTTEKIASPWLETQWNYVAAENRLIPNFKIQYAEPINQNRINSLHVELPKELDHLCKETFANTLTTFLNRIFTRRSARRNAALLVLRKWLNDRFKLVASEKDTTEIYEWLCRWVAERVTADQVTLYYYDHASQCVEKRGFYARTEEARQWEESAYMTAAGKNQRKNSICYRCIDECEVKFTRYFNPETNDAIPAHEPLLLPQGIKCLNQSAIATPILVYDRVWGVLEINGLYPYQFCWNNKTFLEELASIFSSFFYQQHLLDGLHKLNKITIENKSSKQRYGEIAHQLAVIFLSHSATLWIIEPPDDNYKCVGWYNRPDIEQDVVRTKKTNWTNPTDNNIIKNAVRTGNKIILCQNVSEIWLKSQRFAHLKTKYICVIPIYALDKKPIGSICLYNQTNEGFDERWLPKVDLVSKHVALLLEAMQMEQQKEQSMQKKVARNINFIAHDIKLYANLLKDRVISFKNYVSAEFKPNEKQKRRIHLLNYDVITDANDLVENIEWFTSDANKSDGHDAVTQAKNVFDTTTFEWLNFREQFNKVARSYWQIHKKTGIDIDAEWHNHEPNINMHGSNLRRILLNLVSNAVKYTASETLPLIEAEFLPDELEFRISNRAACLEAGEEFRLFEELFRGYHAKNNDIEGTGQGLFIADKICKLYKIGLYYDSKVDPITNVGCLHTFTLSFPPKMLRLEK